MRRKVFAELLKAIEKLRDSANDESALSAVAAYPEWKPSTAFAVGERIRFGENLYRCIQAHTSQEDWTPDATPAMWVRVPKEEYPDWIQPQGSEDAHMAGDKVTHNNKRWTSDIDNNVWEPGIYGWSEYAS